MKNKRVAGFFALFFGIFGVHRYYLGQRFYGVLYMVAFFVGLMITIASDGEAPLVMVPAILSFVDALLFFAMPQDEFDEKFNSGSKRTSIFRKRSRSRQQFEKNDFVESRAMNPFKKSGIARFKEYDFDGAIADFQKSLNQKYKDPATHFNLACCYSMQEDANEALFHLAKSIDFGFVDFEKIYRHEALSFLRVQPEFETFVKNNYHFESPNALPEPEEDLLETEPVLEAEMPKPDLLDQIIRLGDLKEKGILTEEEFVQQKQKILSS